MGIDVWAGIHSERRALTEDLTGLADADYATESLCAGWSVQTCLGHMIATAQMTPLRFVAAMARHRGSFSAMTAAGAAAASDGTPAQTLASFREVETSRSHPPGPTTSWLGETIVHAEDIRRPLGLRRSYPTELVTACLDSFARSNVLIGTKRRIDGLGLSATDVEWHIGDGGAPVQGRAIDLLMAATGRRQALDALSGPGVESLRVRP